MFIGFIEAGVPLGATFSFLISSPLVNEVAVVLLFGLFGWKIALLYLGTGLTIAVVVGYILGRLNLEGQIEPFVFDIKVGQADIAQMTWAHRHNEAKRYVFGVIRKVGVFVLIGVGIGAFIHGYVPVETVVKYTGRDNILAVPIAVMLGIPLYANAAGSIPIIQALIEKGMPMGSALAFMMSVTALSLPEFVILRKVMKTKLLVLFASIVGVSIIAVGYLFNWLIA